MTFIRDTLMIFRRQERLALRNPGHGLCCHRRLEYHRRIHNHVVPYAEHAQDETSENRLHASGDKEHSDDQRAHRCLGVKRAVAASPPTHDRCEDQC